MISKALPAYSYALANALLWTNATEIKEAIRCLKVGKAHSRNGIPNMDLQHSPQQAMLFLLLLLSAVLRTQHFPLAWKLDRMLPIPRPGKDPALPLSHWPMSAGRLTNSLKNRTRWRLTCRVVSGRWLMRDKHFGLRPMHSTSLQLSCSVEWVTRNVGGKRLSGAVFLDVAKVFFAVWVNGLL